jgi:calcium-dependent protein kinase
VHIVAFILSSLENYLNIFFFSLTLSLINSFVAAVDHKCPKNVRIDTTALTTATTTTSTTTTTTSTTPNPKHIRMDESAHTFAPSSMGSASGHASSRHGGSPVMITDALSDVRVHYHIDPKEVGHGHYGVVRKCMHRDSGAWYAIKSIRKSKVSKIEVLKREIEILKEVKHPNIIELFEVYEDERYLHLITELCTGGELFDRIIAKTQSAEGHFSEHDAAVLIRDILDAIAYCHAKFIVHRDLKPENFLFSTEDEGAPVKIIDFGLSRHDDGNMGVMQTKVGTPYYVAPEVLRREYTNACDIWSIGVIAYILLCGYPPFYGDSDTQIFDSVRVGKFDFPSPEWDEISQSAKDFVTELLNKDQAKR